MVHGDLRELDLADATVIVMYLLPEAMAAIAQSHLLPLLRRGDRESRPATPLAGGGNSSVRNTGDELEHRRDNVMPCASKADGAAPKRRPCRIVCNTWGIPGATAVREAGVGLYGGVKLRLFTSDSLPNTDHA